MSKGIEPTGKPSEPATASSAATSIEALRVARRAQDHRVTVKPAARPKSESQRLHALDAVRGGALLLGVLFHASMSFLPGPQVWLTRDVSSVGLGYFWFAVHMFRMTLFFTIAGFFGRMMYHRRGSAAFIRDRLRRIGLPLLLFWPISIVSITIAFIAGAMLRAGGKPSATGAPPPAFHLPTLADFPLTHLWFLYMLLLLYAATLLVRLAVGGIDQSGALRLTLDRLFAPVARSGLAPLVMAVPICAAFWLTPQWRMWSGVPTPEVGLLPNAIAWVAFGSAFAFGWLWNRRPNVMEAWRRVWFVYLCAALGLTVTSAILLGSGGAPVLASAPHDEHTLIYGACYALGIWCWTLGLTGAALQFLSKPSRRIRYIADASYWIYIMHIPVVAALQLLVFRLNLPALVKFAVVCVGAFLILVPSYQLLVRYSALGALLNGQRRDAAE